MKKIVIVESPNKVKTIKKILGEGFLVFASKGHIFEISNVGAWKLGINFEKWIPLYRLMKDKKDFIEEIKKNLNDEDIVYLATDPDREGEAIAKHISDTLKLTPTQSKRIMFNQITKDAILESIENPTIINENLVEAQLSRSMIDRIIGIQLSNLLKRRIMGAPGQATGGRVQSVALKFVVDREGEIKKFIPRKYYSITAKINEKYSMIYRNYDKKDDKDQIDELEIANTIFNSLTNEFIVDNVKTRKVRETKISGLKMSAIYKLAENQYGMKPSTTQSILQKLYEGSTGTDGGLITYPRSDSTRLTKEFITSAHKKISDDYGSEFIENKLSKFDKKDNKSQDAHPAITPTNVNNTPESLQEILDEKQLKIYSLIYFRSLAAVTKVPIRETQSYLLMNNNYSFATSASKIIFLGYYKFLKTKSDLDNNIELSLKVGDKIILTKKDLSLNHHETKPPARFSEGSLISKMENLGIGRPSTFSPTVSKIKNRRFVIREGRSLEPTEFGEIINKKLTFSFPEIINKSYTSNIENLLNQISLGEIKYKDVMAKFFNDFKEKLDVAYEKMEQVKIEPKKINRECPECKSELVERFSRYGKFIGCSNFPTCKYVEFAKKKFTPRAKKTSSDTKEETKAKDTKVKETKTKETKTKKESSKKTKEKK